VAFGNEAARQFENDHAGLLALIPPEKAVTDWRMVGEDWEQYLKAAGDRWREAFIPLLEGVIEDQGNAWNAAFGMQFNVRNLFAEQWFQEYVLVFAQPILETTSNDMSAMLRQAMEEGWDIPTMSGHLEEIFQQYITGDLSPEHFDWFERRMPPYRRELIARTETIRASNAGSFGLFADWGSPMKEWLATADNRTRDSHLLAWAMYGEGGDPGPIPMDQPFIVGGVEMMYPGDPNGTPAEFCNCRCALLPYDPAWAMLDTVVGEAVGGPVSGAVTPTLEPGQTFPKDWSAAQIREYIVNYGVPGAAAMTSALEAELAVATDKEKAIFEVLKGMKDIPNDDENKAALLAVLSGAMGEAAAKRGELDRVVTSGADGKELSRAEALALFVLDRSERQTWRVKWDKKNPFTTADRKTITSARRWIESVTSYDSTRAAVVSVTAVAHSSKRRASYDGRGFMNLAKGTKELSVVHELAHALEFSDTKTVEKERVFWESRTQGEAEGPSGRQYASSERGKVDEFLTRYAGRVYRNPQGKYLGGELISMGVQLLWEDPVGFAKKDPGHFEFTVEVMRGQ